MTDDDSFTGRVRRYARVGGAMAGLGVRLGAERYLGVAIDRERHAADLTAALGGINRPVTGPAVIGRSAPCPRALLATLEAGCGMLKLTSLIATGGR